LSGGDDNDTVRGHNGNDWLSGGEGNDTLNGNDGADILTGFHRKDILDEGSVADISSDSVPVDAYGYVINNFDSGDRIGLSKFEQVRCRT